jgi:FkbM family methyltransferase
VKVFIDLGSHYGSVIRRFMGSSQYTSDYVIYAFEPNPAITNTVLMQYPKCVTIHREAAWLFDGEIEFYLNSNPKYQGATVFKEKTTGWLDKEHPVKVPCIDFSVWLKKFFRKDDQIILKCNIEGAEYPLFNKLMDDGTINFIKKIYMSYHWNKIGMIKEAHDVFVSRLSSFKHLSIVEGNKKI